MMMARRYDDNEVDEILRRATAEQNDASPMLEPGGRSAQSRGLTLTELQEIGAEVGIPSAALERAARALDLAVGGGDARAAPVVPRSLDDGPGTLLPRAAALTAPLSGSLDDEGWERLVAHLRDVFRATGRVEQVGRIRSWRNGNLGVHVEPGPDGSTRIRMHTRSAAVQQMLAGGATSVAMGGVFAAMHLLWQSKDAPFIVAATLCLFMGLALLLPARVRGAAWAQRRQEQFEEIAALAQALVDGPAGGDEPRP